MTKQVFIEGRTPVEDPHYRYKMPAMHVVQEKHYTVITNLRAIASALHRQDSEVLRYLCLSLCTQGKWKDEDGGGGAIKGRFSLAVLEATLRDFIEDFIICHVCRDPGTRYRVRSGKKGKKKGTGATIVQKCSACGAVEQLSRPDHKISEHIVAEYEKAKETRDTTPPPPQKAKERKTPEGQKGPFSSKKEKKKAPTQAVTDWMGAESSSSSSLSTEECQSDEAENRCNEETTDTNGAVLNAESGQLGCGVEEDLLRCIRILLQSWRQAGSDALPCSALEPLLEDVGGEELITALVGLFEKEKESPHAAVFVGWLKELWEEDLLSCEAVEAWAERKEDADATHTRLAKATRPLVAWMREQEEGDSDDGSEE